MMPSNKTRISLPSFLVNKKDVFHIVRRTITSTEELAYHDHDYAEIFWIKEGSGMHLINGEALPINKGYLCMIRPNDTHTFRVDGNKNGLTITNIAFHLETLQVFKKRYFNNSDSYFWNSAKQPFTYELSSEQLSEIASITDYILTQERDYMHLDLIFLHILKILKANTSGNMDMPYWLQYAIDNYQTPHYFKQGLAGFTALTNRTTDHVNKVIKTHLNQTLSETVTRIKVNYAAQKLTMTNVPIKTICYDVGFKSLAYFYKVFKLYKGMPPNEFRDVNHKVF